MEIIEKYFPNLTEIQIDQFRRLVPLYLEWNEKINVISRKDLDNLYERHILHSLAIAKVVNFKAGAELLDLGTGGGIPGIPLAILLPEVNFTLVDGTGKKIMVVKEIAAALDLKNIQAFHARAEDLKMLNTFDFIVTRGVAPLADLWQWSRRLLAKKHQHAMPNGILALKGGNLKAELSALPGGLKIAGKTTEVFPIQKIFREPIFEEKWVVYVQG
jgi:16S rRNA (guanine527-N7)-methyltransferase